MNVSPPQPSLARTVGIYVGFQLFFSLLFWLPVFYEYQKRIGLSDTEIFRIQSIYYVAFCILEIPTGLIADRLGRRRCVRAGAAALVFANLLPIFAQSYHGFLAHFILIALARSFISGASSAYLYDLLDRNGARDDFKAVEGRARAWGLYAKVAVWSVVGYLMQWHLTLPYWLTVAAAAIAFGFAMALPAIESPPAGGLDPAALARHLREVGGSVVRSPFLMIVILQGIATFVLGRIVQVNLFQPILGRKAFSVESYGMVMAVMTAFEAVGSARPGWIRRWLDDFQAVFVLTLAVAGCLCFLPFSDQAGTLAALSLFAYFTGLLYPIQRQLVNDVIPDSRHRATIMSIESIVDRAVNAWLAALIGGYLAAGKLDDYLLLSSALTVAAMAVLWAVSRLKAFRR